MALVCLKKWRVFGLDIPCMAYHHNKKKYLINNKKRPRILGILGAPWEESLGASHDWPVSQLHWLPPFDDLTGILAAHLVLVAGVWG
jgi:hypothetical protein